jgi:predicted MPP superfamily phosphohydrolase
MKILTIGDLHGENTWKDLSFDLYDKVVFIGDYVDSFTESDEDISSNLINIIEIKKKNTEKVELLLGNHDIQYLYPVGRYRCSGYRPSMQITLQTLFEENKELFQIAYQYKNYLWTHAGVSNGWYGRFWQETNELLFSKFEVSTIAEKLNRAYYTRFIDTIMAVGRSRSGTCKFGGPLWADKSELIDTFILELHQIAGHSPIAKIITISDRDNSSITFVDCLGSELDFYEIETEE